MAPIRKVKTYGRANTSLVNNSVDAFNVLFAKNIAKRVIGKNRKKRYLVKELPKRPRCESVLADDSLHISTEDTFDKLFNQKKVNGNNSNESKSKSCILQKSSFYSPIMTRQRKKNTSESASSLKLTETTDSLEGTHLKRLKEPSVEKINESLEVEGEIRKRKTSLSYIKIPNALDSSKLGVSMNCFTQNLKNNLLTHCSTPVAASKHPILINHTISPVKMNSYMQESVPTDENKFPSEFEFNKPTLSALNTTDNCLTTSKGLSNFKFVESNAINESKQYCSPRKDRSFITLRKQKVVKSAINKTRKNYLIDSLRHSITTSLEKFNQFVNQNLSLITNEKDCESIMSTVNFVTKKKLNYEENLNSEVESSDFQGFDDKFKIGCEMCSFLTHHKENPEIFKPTNSCNHSLMESNFEDFYSTNITKDLEKFHTTNYSYSEDDANVEKIDELMINLTNRDFGDIIKQSTENIEGTEKEGISKRELKVKITRLSSTLSNNKSMENGVSRGGITERSLRTPSIDESVENNEMTDGIRDLKVNLTKRSLRIHSMDESVENNDTTEGDSVGIQDLKVNLTKRSLRTLSMNESVENNDTTENDSVGIQDLKVNLTKKTLRTPSMDESVENNDISENDSVGIQDLKVNLTKRSLRIPSMDESVENNDTTENDSVVIQDLKVNLTKNSLRTPGKDESVENNDTVEDDSVEIQDLKVNHTKRSLRILNRQNNRQSESKSDTYEHKTADYTLRIDYSSSDILLKDGKPPKALDKSDALFESFYKDHYGTFELPLPTTAVNISNNSDVIESSYIDKSMTKGIKHCSLKRKTDIFNNSDVINSSIISNADVDKDGFKIPITPIKNIHLKAGKSWKRSLSKYKRTSSLGLSGEECCSPYLAKFCPKGKSNRRPPNKGCSRRLSVRLEPLEPLHESQTETALQEYASNASYVQDQIIEDSLEDSLRCLSLNRKNSINKSRDQARVTAKDIVLRRCGQTEPLDFAECFPNSVLQHCHKIGEGVYGEVFLFRNPAGGTSVIKIVPVEGDQIVNGERQKKFEEVLSEIIITMELSNLRNNERNGIAAFTEVQKIQCVQGRYPEKFIDMWDLFYETKGSENDCPDIFGDDQLYIIFQMAYGGRDLESYLFNNAMQAYSMFQQVSVALAIAEEELHFEHRDLHWGNVLVSTVESNKTVTFNMDDQNYEIPTKGVEVAIIDFTLSRIEHEGVVIFNDLSLDPDLFTAEGDYQFEIYRQMQSKNRNEWRHFEPFSNLLWLHYILDKAVLALRYKNAKSKRHRDYLLKLEMLKEDVLSYQSVKEFVAANFLGV